MHKTQLTADWQQLSTIYVLLPFDHEVNVSSIVGFSSTKSG